MQAVFFSCDYDFLTFHPVQVQARVLVCKGLSIISLVLSQATCTLGMWVCACGHMQDDIAGDWWSAS